MGILGCQSQESGGKDAKRFSGSRLRCASVPRKLAMGLKMAVFHPQTMKFRVAGWGKACFNPADEAVVVTWVPSSGTGVAGEFSNDLSRRMKLIGKNRLYL